MFHFDSCPFCKQARDWLKEIQAEDPELAAVPVEMIDEKRDPARAEQYDYWYVPTFYVDGKKLHEGAATREIVEQVLRAAL